MLECWQTSLLQLNVRDSRLHCHREAASNMAIQESLTAAAQDTKRTAPRVSKKLTADRQKATTACLASHQRVPHTEVLSQSHEGVIHCCVTMRVVLAQDLCRRVKLIFTGVLFEALLVADILDRLLGWYTCGNFNVG